MKKQLISAFLVLVALVSLFSCAKGIDEEALWAGATYQADTELGTGDKAVHLYVEVGSRSVLLTVHTNEEKLVDALLSLGLIQGDEGPYGLYLNTVNGITADYSRDQSWWKLLDTDGNSLDAGISSITAEDGTAYKLAYTVS